MPIIDHPSLFNQYIYVGVLLVTWAVGFFNGYVRGKAAKVEQQVKTNELRGCGGCCMVRKQPNEVG